jgi:class 3 adenylate cyclase
MHRIIRIVRLAVKLGVFLIAFFLIAGFIAQFLPARRYPWVVDIWPYVWPITATISRYIPTVFQGYDVSLLIALAILGGFYFFVDQFLWKAEDAARRPVIAPAARSAPPEAPKAAASVSQKAPVYSSEAVVVIDLVNSTSLVTRFGNTFLLMLKHRLEHQVADICNRNAACYSKSTGDGFLMFFPTLANSMTALREIFDALPAMNADLPDGAEIALRAAVNFGEVIADRDGDRTGSAVHKTFRLQSLPPASLIEAEGGIRRSEFPEKNYTLVSEEAISGLARMPSVQSRFLGLCELKGFPGLHRVYRV